MEGETPLFLFANRIMTDIKFTNAAKYFDENNKSHVDAFEYLQHNCSPAVVEEFAKRFRATSSAPVSTSSSSSPDEVPAAGIKLIKEFEGCHLNAYPDPLTGGLPITIGWGSTRDKNGKPFKMGNKLTQAEADQLLIDQCKKEFLPSLRKIPGWNEMSDNQRGALLSFAYNLGAGFYGDTANFNSITRALSSKANWGSVPDALYKYRNPGTNVEAGLARRRKAEGEVWKRG